MNLDGLNEDFKDLLLALADARADFVVVGAYALAAHGIPRTTGDIDVLVRADPQNAIKVYAALLSFGAPLAVAGVLKSDFETPGQVYQIGLPPRRIDVLTNISGVSFDEALVDKKVLVLDGRSIAFIGREALIANKPLSATDRWSFHQ